MLTSLRPAYIVNKIVLTAQKGYIVNNFIIDGKRCFINSPQTSFTKAFIVNILTIQSTKQLYIKSGLYSQQQCYIVHINYEVVTQLSYIEGSDFQMALKNNAIQTSISAGKYGRIPFKSDYSVMNGMTICFWVRPILQNPTQNRPILWKSGAFRINRQSDTKLFFNFVTYQNNNITTNYLLTYAKWHHLTFIFENGQTSLYVNGQFYATYSTPGTYINMGTSGDIFVSNDQSLNNDLQLADLRIYNYAINPADIPYQPPNLCAVEACYISNVAVDGAQRAFINAQPSLSLSVNKLVYIYGPILSTQSAYISSNLILSGSKKCFIKAAQIVVVQKNAYIVSNMSATTNVDMVIDIAYVPSTKFEIYYGSVVYPLTKDVKIRSAIILSPRAFVAVNGYQSAFLVAGIAVGSLKNCFIAGRPRIRSEKMCFVNANRFPITSVRPAMLIAGLGGTKHAYVSSTFITNLSVGILPCFVNSVGGAPTSNKLCYINSRLIFASQYCHIVSAVAANSLPVYIHGIPVQNTMTVLYCYIQSNRFVASNQFSYMFGTYKITSSRLCYINVIKFVFAPKLCYLHIAWNIGNRTDLFTFGHYVMTSQTNAYIQWTLFVENSFNMFIKPYDYREVAQKCFIVGETITSVKNIFVCGHKSVSASIGSCYILGHNNLKCFIATEFGTTISSNMAYISDNLRQSSKNCYIPSLGTKNKVQYSYVQGEAVQTNKMLYVTGNYIAYTTTRAYIGGS